MRDTGAPAVAGAPVITLARQAVREPSPIGHDTVSAGEEPDAVCVPVSASAPVIRDSGPALKAGGQGPVTPVRQLTPLMSLVAKFQYVSESIDPLRWKNRPAVEVAFGRHAAKPSVRPTCSRATRPIE